MVRKNIKHPVKKSNFSWNNKHSQNNFVLKKIKYVFDW